MSVGGVLVCSDPPFTNRRCRRSRRLRLSKTLSARKGLTPRAWRCLSGSTPHSGRGHEGTHAVCADRTGSTAASGYLYERQ